MLMTRLFVMYLFILILCKIMLGNRQSQASIVLSLHNIAFYIVFTERTKKYLNYFSSFYIQICCLGTSGLLVNL